MFFKPITYVIFIVRITKPWFISKKNITIWSGWFISLNDKSGQRLHIKMYFGIFENITTLRGARAAASFVFHVFISCV